MPVGPPPSAASRGVKGPAARAWGRPRAASPGPGGAPRVAPGPPRGEVASPPPGYPSPQPEFVRIGDVRVGDVRATVPEHRRLGSAASPSPRAGRLDQLSGSPVLQEGLPQLQVSTAHVSALPAHVARLPPASLPAEASSQDVYVTARGAAASRPAPQKRGVRLGCCFP